MVDPRGPAVRTGILGPLLVVVVAVLTAVLLFLPLMLFGLGVGGPALLAVLAVAVGVFLALARRFRLPVRPWVFGGVAGSLRLAAAALWVAF